MAVSCVPQKYCTVATQSLALASQPSQRGTGLRTCAVTHRLDMQELGACIQTPAATGQMGLYLQRCST